MSDSVWIVLIAAVVIIFILVIWKYRWFRATIKHDKIEASLEAGEPTNRATAGPPSPPGDGAVTVGGSVSNSTIITHVEKGRK